MDASPDPTPTTPWQGARSLGLAAVLAVGFVLGLDAVRAEPGPATPRQMKVQVAALRTAQLSYFDAVGQYVALDPANEAGHAAAREQLGWEPYVKVDCLYAVAVDATRFTIEVVCPTADGRERAWGYVRSGADGAPGLDGRLGRCRGEGVLHRRDEAPSHRDVTGACDAASLPGGAV